MKYIPAQKLIAEIERLKGQLIRGACAAQIEMETNCKDEAYNEILSIITSLQQEQSEVDDPEYGPYARQYPKSKVSQEQPEVDLEKEINSYCGTRDIRPVPDFMDAVARHFFELGLNTRKK